MFEIIKAQNIEGYSVPDGLQAFVALDNGVLCGTLMFTVERKKMILADIKLEKEVDGLDLDDALLRTAANCCREQEIKTAECSNRFLEDRLLRLGFEKKSKKTYRAELDYILRKQCRHGE